MDLLLNNKKILVSGSTTGIGYAIAKGFAKEGATVYLNGRSESNVNDALKRLSREVSSAKVTGVVADLATEEGFTKLTKELSAVDVLVNNLGIYEPVDFFESTDTDWQKL